MIARHLTCMSGGMRFLADIRFGPAGYPAAAKGKLSRVFSILNDKVKQGNG